MRKIVMPAIACLGLSIALTACSGDTEISGGKNTPQASSIAPKKTETPSPAPSTIADGVLEPSNAPTPPPQDPSIPRSGEAPEATKFAQGFASALLYFDVLYIPGAEKLGASLMQSPPGLSITQLVKWYEYVKSDSAYAQNRATVEGYLFVPPDRENRRYAVPAVQEIKYSLPKISEGPPSSIDSRPTLNVSFQMVGELVWVDREGVAWKAPASRVIDYVMASQNDGWVVDDWKNTEVKIGKAQRVPREEASAYSFTPWESDTDIDYPFPTQ